MFWFTWVCNVYIMFWFLFMLMPYTECLLLCSILMCVDHISVTGMFRDFAKGMRQGWFLFPMYFCFRLEYILSCFYCCFSFILCFVLETVYILVVYYFIIWNNETFCLFNCLTYSKKENWFIDSIFHITYLVDWLVDFSLFLFVCLFVCLCKYSSLPTFTCQVKFTYIK